MPPGDAPHQPVERIWTVHAEIHPSHRLEEHRNLWMVAAGQQHRDHRAASPDKLIEEGPELLILPRPDLGTDDDRGGRNVKYLLLDQRLERKPGTQFLLVQP